MSVKDSSVTVSVKPKLSKSCCKKHSSIYLKSTFLLKHIPSIYTQLFVIWWLLVIVVKISRLILIVVYSSEVNEYDVNLLWIPSENLELAFPI